MTQVPVLDEQAAYEEAMELADISIARLERELTKIGNILGGGQPDAAQVAQERLRNALAALHTPALTHHRMSRAEQIAGIKAQARRTEINVRQIRDRVQVALAELTGLDSANLDVHERACLDAAIAVLVGERKEEGKS